jgi:leucine dehydrogenase
MKIELLDVAGYEKVFKVTDSSVGLNAFIALHDLALGPALGGIRIYPYHTSDEALTDVLRLAQGMTYKNAIAKLGFGGGKSVIIADPKTQKTPKLLRAFGKVVEQIGGEYICAQDLGCTSEDLKEIRKETRYVVGLIDDKSSGDPSIFASYGVYWAMQATAKVLTGSDSLKDLTIAIQGIGSVGSNLAEFLFWAGANLIIADIDPKALRAAVISYAPRVVSSEEIFFVKCDILAPCALGAILNDQTIPKLHCRAIVGGANNQLLAPSHGDALRHRGIIYAPDFVVNAGGAINVAAELEVGGYHPAASRDKVRAIYDSLLEIYEIAKKRGESTHEAAVTLAKHRLKEGIGKRTAPPVYHH